MGINSNVQKQKLLQAQIQNFSYKKIWCESLKNAVSKNINDLPSKCLMTLNNKTLALSKWVSPKRTRSYPYARVYDTFDTAAQKIVTVIPIIKDEGINGDIDYLQWDTVSLMSLLNIYVILGFYDKAEKHKDRENKIINQQFNNEYIMQQLESLTTYHQSALHWNLNQLENNQLLCLIEHVKNAYQNIKSNLNVKLHNSHNIDKFAEKISQDTKSFMTFSRQKAQDAQHREILTTQPKEHIGIGEKTKIMIQNYLGGQYFFTIDDVIYKNDTVYLCESKHSKNALLPSNDDIKDGLLKLMLYNNLSQIQGIKKFKVVLRLTSDILRESFLLPNNNLDNVVNNNSLLVSKIQVLKALNKEAQQNNFEIWINNGLS